MSSRIARPRSLSRYLMTLWLFLCWPATSPLASPQAEVLDVAWMNWAQVKLAAQVFPRGDFDLFVERVEKVIAANSDGSKPPMETSDDFRYVSREYRQPLVDLLRSSLAAGAQAKVKGFLSALNQGRWLRGKFHAKGGGAIVVVVEIRLGVDDAGNFTTVFLHRRLDGTGPTKTVVVPTNVSGTYLQ